MTADADAEAIEPRAARPGRAESRHPRARLHQSQPRQQRDEPEGRAPARRRARSARLARLSGRQIRDGARGDRAHRDHRRRARGGNLRRALRRASRGLGRARQSHRVHGDDEAGRHDHRAAARDRRPCHPPRGGRRRLLRSHHATRPDRRRELHRRSRPPARGREAAPAEADHDRRQPQPVSPSGARIARDRRRGRRAAAL